MHQKRKLKCENCGVEYITNTRPQKHHFCSKSCFHKWNSGKNNAQWKDRVMAVCVHCKNNFYILEKVLKRRVDLGFAIVCSKRCSAGNLYNKKTIIKTCLNCGEKIRLSPSTAHKKFCNKKCAFHYIKKNNINSGKNNANWRGVGYIVFKCVMCGKETKRHGSVIPKFCSRDCSAKYLYGVRVRGDDVRKWYMYKKWRKEVFKKYGISGKGYHIHHIKPLFMLIKEAEQAMPLLNWKQAVLAYSPIWDVNNGEVLLAEKHMKLHNGGVQ